LSQIFEENAVNAMAAEGGCDCKAVRYRMLAEPMIVHCCHCRWCQRETGASFALNAVIESSRLVNSGVTPELVPTPTESGSGQQIARCPTCKIAVWSHYSGTGPVLAFVRVGTLDNPDRLTPDVHIFTASKQSWVVIPQGARAFEHYYDPKQVWSPEAQARYAALRPEIEAYRRARNAGGQN
jgi:hypothetical protein